jgi:hypothetical protein
MCVMLPMAKLRPHISIVNMPLITNKTVITYCKMFTYRFREVHRQMLNVNPFASLLLVADETPRTYF